MLTIVFVIVVSAAVVGSMWMLRNMQPQGDSAESSLFPIRDSMRSDSDERGDSDFHAVAIRPCKDACAAVKALEGKRFLSTTRRFCRWPTVTSPCASVVISIIRTVVKARIDVTS